MGKFNQFMAWAGHKAADFWGKNDERTQEAAAEFVAGVTTDPIGMAGDLKDDTVLTDSLVNDIKNTIKDYQAASLGWPGSLVVVKKDIGNFTKHLTKEIENYRKSIMECVKSSDLKFKSCKDDVLKSLDGISKVCSDSRILRYNTDALRELITETKQTTLNIEGESIGDFSEKVATCANKMKARVRHSFDMASLRTLLTGVEHIRKKDLEKKRKSELKKDSPSRSQKVMGAAFETWSDARRMAGNLVGGVFTAAPIPLVVFGEFLGRSTAHSCEISLTKYLSILELYNPGLNAYRSACLKFIPKITKLLTEYYSALAVFSKSKLSYKDKLKAKQAVLDLLKKLKKELEFKGKISQGDVATIKETEGGEVLSSVAPGKAGAEAAGAIKYKIDGWALIDFVEALKTCVETTVEELKLNTLINLEDDVIDYESLEIKAPTKPASDEKKAKAEPKAVPAGAAIKESSKIAGQRKVLVKILEEAIKIFKDATDLKHEVTKSLNPLNFVNEKGYNSLAKQFSEEYEALGAAYNKVRVGELEDEYTLGNGRQAVRTTEVILITSDLKVNSKFLTEALTVSRTINESTVSKLYTHLTSQCMDNLSDMKRCKSGMKKISDNMIATYGGTSKEYDKACKELTEILNEARKVGASAFERQDSISEFAGAIRLSSDDTTVQRFNTDNEVVQQKIGKLNATYDSMRNYLYYGGEFQLIDSNGHVTQEMRRLTLSQLKEVKEGCSGKLEKMEKKADEIEKLQEKLIKDFGGEKTKIDKARTKALKNLEEINNVREKEAALVTENNRNRDNYVQRYGVEINEIYATFETNKALLDAFLNTNEQRHALVTADRIANLKLDVVDEFNADCAENLPDAKKRLKAMNSELSKIKKGIASREKSYNKVKASLTKNLEKAVKIYNDASDDKNSVDQRTAALGAAHNAALPQSQPYTAMVACLNSLKQQIDGFDQYIYINGDASQSASLGFATLNSAPLAQLEADLERSKGALTEMSASKKEFDKQLKAYTKELERTEAAVLGANAPGRKRGFLGRFFGKRSGG